MDPIQVGVTQMFTIFETPNGWYCTVNGTTYGVWSYRELADLAARMMIRKAAR